MEHPPSPEVTAKGVLLPESRKTPLDSHGKIRISYIYICVRLYVNISICIPLRDLLAAKTTLCMKYFLGGFSFGVVIGLHVCFTIICFFWQLSTLVLF